MIRTSTETSGFGPLSASDQASPSRGPLAIAWLDQLAFWLLLAMPFMFLVGRAAADIVLSATAVLFLVHSAVTGRWQWLRTPWVGVALLLWLYLIAVSPFAQNADNAFGRSLPFGRFILFAAAVQHWVLTDRRRQQQFLLSLALVVGFVVFDTLLQFVLGRDLFGHEPIAKFRLNGPFDSNVPGTFITKTSLPLVGVCFGWAILRGRWTVALGIGVCALLFTTILLSGERTAFLTFGLAMVLFLIALPKLRWPLLVAGLVCTMVLGGTLAVSKATAQRLIGHTLADVDHFFANRYGIIVIKGLKVWQTSPWIGVGLKNFRLDCRQPDFKPRGPVETWCFMHPHNVYMEWLVEAGLIGLGGFVALLVVLGIELLRRLRGHDPTYPLQISAALALVMFLFPFMSGMSFFTNWNAALFWMMLGLALAVCAPRPDGRSASQSTGTPAAA